MSYIGDVVLRAPRRSVSLSPGVLGEIGVSVCVCARARECLYLCRWHFGEVEGSPNISEGFKGVGDLGCL